ncbi:hypothetical protein [Nocardiopsis listeri]|uniref:hypothetical protein n=1 Tax=Nocardiopsis listeri TaxID=53440 RepID=UPI0008310F7E|nr:hypothetical protein [Nocardiopsis listeri]
MTLDTLDVPVANHLCRLRATFRKRGWTIWHGDSTGQYWAAHTGLMVLVSGDSAQTLTKEIERIQPSRYPAKVPTPRRFSPWRRPDRTHRMNPFR